MKDPENVTRQDAIEFFILAVKGVSSHLAKGDTAMEISFYGTAERYFELLGVTSEEVHAALEVLIEKDKKIEQERMELIKTLANILAGPPEHTQN